VSEEKNEITAPETVGRERTLRTVKERTTTVRIAANGHLGAFTREYTLAIGREWQMLARMLKDIIQYVRAGWRKQEEELLGLIAKLEEEAAK